MSLRAVLFDYGSTLVDFGRTQEALLTAYEQARDLVVEGVEDASSVPEAARLVDVIAGAMDAIVEESYEQERLEELDLLVLFDEAFRAIGLTLPPAVLRAIAELDHAAYRASLVLPDETRAVLEELRGRGLRLGFVSNAHYLPELMREDFSNLGLAPLLDAGVFSAEIGTRKPDPRIFHHVLGELGVAPAEAIHVGDRVRDDVGGAIRAGMRGGVLTHQWRQEEPRGIELAVITRLSELPPLLV